jgi:Zn-dependent protease with chaperone function
LNFFSQQDQARRQTRRMVALFVFAVVAIVVAVDLVAAVVYLGAMEQPIGEGALAAKVPRALLVWCSLGTLALIAGGTIFRVMELAKGGVAVAEMVGATRVNRDSQNPGERRLLNVVEEMAIAAGISVPQVYLMGEEKGINAFAAGYTPNEAVVAVTRGTVDTLSRDELQGVIAHEFSHIMNGDMRLNIHLIGVLNGILLIGSIGLFAMRSAGQIRGSKESAGLIFGLFFVGLALAAIGYVGVVFARLIKAAVSRQREFLADASAVQYTRNPEGIGGALYKIGKSTGLIANRHAEDLSHMYFGQSMKTSLAGLFDTHPPLEDRIKRVLGPNAMLFTRKQDRTAAAGVPEFEGAVSALAQISAAVAPDAQASGTAWGKRPEAALRTTAQAVLASVGTPTTQHMDYARELLAALPAELRQAVGTQDGAKAALFALLLGANEVLAAQLALIERAEDSSVAAKAAVLAGQLRPLGARVRLPILDLAVPTLVVLAQPERDRILLLVKDLAEADRKVSIAEFVVLTLCKRYLGAHMKGAPPVKHKSLATVRTEIETVVSMLVHAARSPFEAYERAITSLGFEKPVLRPAAEISAAAVEGALYELKLLAPLAKPAVIKACLAVVMYDGKISVVEAELMRAIAAALDSPLPPILEAPSIPQERAA